MATMLSAQTAASAGPRRILKKAIDDFHSVLTDSDRNRLRQLGAVRDAETVMIFTAQLDRENQLRKGRGVANRLISVLHSVHAFSTVVDTFVSSHPEIAALIWGSIKFAMLIAVNYTSYFEALSSLFMSFSNCCPRFAEYQALYPASTRLQKALCDFHASIIRCCKRVVETIQRPWQKQLTNAFWQSFDQEFKPYKNEIQTLAKEVTDEIELAKSRACSQDQRLQQLERAAASKHRLRILGFMPVVEKELDEIRKLQLEQSTRLSREEKHRLLEFLSSHEYMTPFQEACQKRQHGTAEWIFSTSAFNRWCNGTESPLLWCSGKIGSGKTVLCANVINHVLANQGADVRVAFFFTQYNNSESLRAETIIRSITRQFIDTTILTQHIEQCLKALSRNLFNKLQDWVYLAQQAIGSSNTFYVFIDGLDEPDAAERRALLEALSSLISTAPHLKIFASGRDSVHLDIKDRFLNMEHILMSSDNTASDIYLYIETAIQERIQNRDLIVGDPRLLDNIKQTLGEHADGMFLWVVFLINEICIANCDDDIRRQLRTLPRDLEETFSRALLRIITRQRRADLAQKVFQWVAAAKRPLNLSEIRDAISIEIGQEYLRPDRQVRELSPIVTWCENLLQVTEGLLLVQFAHSTVRDFMMRTNLPAQLKDFHINLEEVDHLIGEICITYLHLNDFKTVIARKPQQLRMDPMAMASTALGQRSSTKLATRLAYFALRNNEVKEPLDIAKALANHSKANVDQSSKSLQDQHPLLKYAAKYWIFHTSNFQEGKSITWKLWQQIIIDGHTLAHLPWQNSPCSNINNAIFIWSHQMCHYALLRYSSELFSLAGSIMDDSMILSASQGDTKAMMIFLKAGRYSLRGLDRSLQEASKYGPLQVIEQLLTAGADVNAYWSGVIRPTALQAAAEGGHIQVIEQLLAAKADVNAAAAQYNGRTALQAAAEGGHLQAIELLLAAGADINTTAAQYNRQAALQAAAGGGHLQIMDRLLNARVDINIATGCEGLEALQAAARGGHLQAIERLLAAGADINIATGRKGLEALQTAAGDGHLQIVDRLLNAGVDINAATGYIGLTALQAASKGGHLQVVDRLLNAGVDINAATGYTESTALQAASKGGHLQVVDRLLAAGANIDISIGTGRYIRTALQSASEGGHLQVVDRLLAAGADVNAIHTGNTALQAASEGGHLQVVNRLLIAGARADIDAIYSSNTALQAASENGHLHVVERLLAAGADVNAAPANRKLTAFQLASQCGYLKIMERLLAAGADVNAAAENYGRTALQAAAEDGRLHIVERLLAAGADVNAVHGARGLTALQLALNRGHLQIVDRLLAAGADINAALEIED